MWSPKGEVVVVVVVAVVEVVVVVVVVVKTATAVPAAAVVVVVTVTVVLIKTVVRWLMSSLTRGVASRRCAQYIISIQLNIALTLT